MARINKQRITKKDIDALDDAISFIAGNTECVFDKKEIRYYNDQTRRIAKIVKILRSKITKRSAE